MTMIQSQLATNQFLSGGFFILIPECMYVWSVCKAGQQAWPLCDYPVKSIGRINEIK